MNTTAITLFSMVFLVSGVISGSQMPHHRGSDTAQDYVERPSIRELHFDPATDAKALRRAMKGFGTDEDTIISILARRTTKQRQRISKAFDKEFGRDLVKDLKSELSGKLETVAVALMTPRVEFLARQINNAISSIFTKESTIIDILCPASNDEISEIKNKYKEIYDDSLATDLQESTSGSFQDILVTLSKATRTEDPNGHKSLASKDAHQLYKAGENVMEADEAEFISLLTTRSFSQLRLLLDEYERLAGHPLEKTIEKVFSGDSMKALLAIVKSARNRAAYFAERVHNSLAGLGTKDQDLIFVIVSRAEIDMENIKEEYQKAYGRSLVIDVSDDTSGDYERILLTLIGT